MPVGAITEASEGRPSHAALMNSAISNVQMMQELELLDDSQSEDLEREPVSRQQNRRRPGIPSRRPGAH